MVDPRSNRLTGRPRSASSTPFSWERARPALMFVAANPGCKAPDVCAALETKNTRFMTRRRRLTAMGLIIGSHRYQINTAIQHEMRLVRFLRALAEAYGIPSGECSTRPLRGKRAILPGPGPLPANLFGTPTRTRILLLIASLGESYMEEMHHVIGVDATSGPRHLADFLNEGVLSTRLAYNVKVYSLNPGYPGARDLEVLLRRMAVHTPRICAAANVALVRRFGLGTMHGQRRALVADLDAHARASKRKTTWGVRREVGHRVWRIGHGLSDYGAFQK